MNRLFNAILARFARICPGGYSLRPALHRLRGVHLGTRVWISQDVYIDELYPEAVTIGSNVTIGIRTSIFTHFHWGPRRAEGGYKPVQIGDNAFIGPHCVILPGVVIGEGAVVKAGSVVSSNIPPRVFWGAPSGRPLAKVTVPLIPESGYEEFVRGLRPFSQRPAPRPASSGARAPHPQEPAPDPLTPHS